ncbi:hypothetical protein QR680_003118 [Steinernema hermaphroditum]|uniref:SET domain-containing protein n=1 Tax=Steinernema hermaphroditum TaxID=289476 RepID=A0AA39H7M4_9BILA|nr:hypothetical protein QR680_003118 [Steinernema hermaphroditum]
MANILSKKGQSGNVLKTVQTDNSTRRITRSTVVSNIESSRPSVESNNSDGSKKSDVKENVGNRRRFTRKLVRKEEANEDLQDTITRRTTRSALEEAVESDGNSAQSPANVRERLKNEAKQPTEAHTKRTSTKQLLKRKIHLTGENEADHDNTGVPRKSARLAANDVQEKQATSDGGQIVRRKNNLSDVRPSAAIRSNAIQEANRYATNPEAERAVQNCRPGPSGLVCRVRHGSPILRKSARLGQRNAPNATNHVNPNAAHTVVSITGPGLRTLKGLSTTQRKRVPKATGSARTKCGQEVSSAAGKTHVVIHRTRRVTRLEEATRFKAYTEIRPSFVRIENEPLGEHGNAESYVLRYGKHNVTGQNECHVDPTKIVSCSVRNPYAIVQPRALRFDLVSAKERWSVMKRLPMKWRKMYVWKEAAVTEAYGQAALYFFTKTPTQPTVENFQFSLETLISRKAKRRIQDWPLLPGCCNEHVCFCIKGQQWYGCCGGKFYWSTRTHKELREEIVRDPKSDYGVRECGALCPCSLAKCKDRVLQRGRQHRVFIAETEGKGLGLFALDTIEKGALATEYVGRLVIEDEADADQSYQWDLDLIGRGRLIIDSRKYGNESRFANHSCDPNMFSVKVRVDFDTEGYHRVGLFTNREIRPGKELTIDYFNQNGRRELPTKSFVSGKSLVKVEKCRCGRKACSGLFLSGKPNEEA